MYARAEDSSFAFSSLRHEEFLCFYAQRNGPAAQPHAFPYAGALKLRCAAPRAASCVRARRDAGTLVILYCALYSIPVCEPGASD